MSVVLDSVILIDAMNGVTDALEYIKRVGPEASITAITRAEVLVGYAPDEQRAPRAVLDRLGWIELDREVTDLAAQMRREHRWKLPDAFQAAAAVHNGLALATRNTKDFPAQRHEFVVVPYEL